MLSSLLQEKDRHGESHRARSKWKAISGPIRSGYAALAVLRDELGLTGTKYGCGEGQCGACTVLLGDVPRRSCQVPLRAALAQPITTIEGLEKDGRSTSRTTGVSRCRRLPMRLLHLRHDHERRRAPALQSQSDPAEIIKSLQGNICRCGTHPRVVDAVAHAAKAMQQERR